MSTLTATTPDGKTFSPKYRRAYTHAIICQTESGWGVASYATSLDLATKRRARLEKFYGGEWRVVSLEVTA